MQLAQIQALDKLRPLLTSPKPAEREFGYASFAALGYEEIALRIVEINKDISGKSLAEQLATSEEERIRTAAENTLRSLSKTDKLINKFETGDIQGLRPRAINVANANGLNSELSIAVIQDAMTQHGFMLAKRFVEQATNKSSGTPKDGISEKIWLLNYLEARKEHSKGKPFAKFIERRIGELNELVQKEDWNLDSIQ